MKELLNLEHINFKYEEKYHALKDISVKIYEGERIAVLGKNGAGKSTFFLCCNGVIKPESGKIFLKGREVLKKDISMLRQAVGLVFQDPDSQIIAGTVENEISFGPMNLKLNRDEVIKRVQYSLKKMNLTGYENRPPQYLSGGEKKRVSIADILAMKPDMILLDEPTASLDPENVEILEKTLNDLTSAGIALVVSTHDVDFAFRFANRAIVFCMGEVILDADVNHVFSSDDILLKAGLKKPLIYSVTEMLKERFVFSNSKIPRTLEELQNFIK